MNFDAKRYTDVEPITPHFLRQFSQRSKSELGRRERFRVFASSRIRREGILVTRWAKTQLCWKRREHERRDVSQTRNFAYFKI